MSARGAVTGAVRIVALATVVAIMALAAACGDAETSSTGNSCSPSPATSPSHAASARPYDGFLGWWTTERGFWGTIHIFKRGSIYQLDGLSKQDLRAESGELSLTALGGDVRIEFSLSADGRLLLHRWTTGDEAEGKVNERVQFRRAGADEIDDYINNTNFNRLAGAIDAWFTSNGTYPPPSALQPDGAIGKGLSPWPTNPYTEQPMAPGSDPGDYRYSVRDGGFKLTFFTPMGEMTRTGGSQATPQ